MILYQTHVLCPLLDNGDQATPFANCFGQGTNWNLCFKPDEDAKEAVTEWAEQKQKGHPLSELLREYSEGIKTGGCHYAEDCFNF